VLSWLLLHWALETRQGAAANHNGREASDFAVDESRKGTDDVVDY
jgi:hypothetical protein